MSMIEAIRAALRHEMAAGTSGCMVLGEDVGKQGGVFRATEGLQKEFGTERVVDTPVSEAAIIGASIGLATAGMVPVAELQFLGFAHQAFHQIGFQLGPVPLPHARPPSRSRSRSALPTAVACTRPSCTRTPSRRCSPTHPGIKIVAPSTAADAKGLLLSAPSVTPTR
jgi:pyruvate dehydrogenase E1 component beta subunit